jgi:hypothetical protein
MTPAAPLMEEGHLVVHGTHDPLSRSLAMFVSLTSISDKPAAAPKNLQWQMESLAGRNAGRTMPSTLALPQQVESLFSRQLSNHLPAFRFSNSNSSLTGLAHRASRSAGEAAEARRPHGDPCGNQFPGKALESYAVSCILLARVLFSGCRVIINK